MKLHFTHDWLRHHIENDPDIECDAGFPIRGSEPLKQFVEPATKAQSVEHTAAPEQKSVVFLFRFVQLLRQRDGLSREQLADRVQISPEEVEAIETQQDYVPRARTVYQLAKYVNVTPKAVEQMTVAARPANDVTGETISRFAAKSDDLSQLSPAGKRAFNDFIKSLAASD